MVCYSLIVMTDLKRNDKHSLAMSYKKLRRDPMKKLLVIGFAIALMCTGSCTIQHSQVKAENQIQAQKVEPVLTAAEKQKKAQVEKALNGPNGAQIKSSVKKYSQMYKVDEKMIHAVILTE